MEGNKKHRGVFQWPDRGDIWWIRYVGLDGKEHRQTVGSYEEAVAAYEQRRRARQRQQRLKRLGVDASAEPPAPPAQPEASPGAWVPERTIDAEAVLAELNRQRAWLDATITVVRAGLMRKPGK